MSEEIRFTDFRIKEETKELFFTINDKSKYKVPSRLFPLSSKKNSGLFSTETTVPYENQEFFDLINKIDLPMGHCYSNSEKIRKIAEQLNIKAHYYSGWIFKMGDYPKHHAWIAIEHEAGYSIVDSLKDNIFKEAYKRCPITYDDVNWRSKIALTVKEVIKDMPLNTQQIIIGQVSGTTFYIGSPDTAENAGKIFRDLRSKFPNHPAYKGDGDSMEGASKLQEAMQRIGIY